MGQRSQVDSLKGGEIMGSTEKVSPAVIVLALAATAGFIGWAVSGGGGKPSETPATPSTAVTVVSYPDCADAQPTCVRSEDGRWFLVSGYQGGKTELMEVQLLHTETRHGITWHTVKVP
jgi:hypothetical protein